MISTEIDLEGDIKKTLGKYSKRFQQYLKENNISGVYKFAENLCKVEPGERVNRIQEVLTSIGIGEEIKNALIINIFSKIQKYHEFEMKRKAAQATVRI
jgi:hypothetical protein